MKKAKYMKNKKIIFALIFLLVLGFVNFINFKESFFSSFSKFVKQNKFFYPTATQSNEEDNFIISCDQGDLIEDQKTISAEEAGEIF